MASYAGQVKIGSSNLPIGSTLYGTCETAAATVAKVVVCANFDQLITGVTIHVKFTYSNTAANPTLNVNSTGAKSIYRYGSTAAGNAASSSWNAGAVISFTYDGSAWQMNDWINTDSNNMVAQTPATTNADYEVLFSSTADNTTRIEGAKKNSNLKFNPSTGNLQATQLNGVTIGSSPKFTDTTYSSQAAASGGTAVSLCTTGEKYTWNNKLSTAHSALTVTLSSSSWNSSKQQSVTASGVTASNTVMVSPAPVSLAAYGEAGVYCSAQASNSLTFTYTGSAPSSNLTVNVVILK